MLSLRTTLLVNGISSGITGALLVIFSGASAQLFKLPAKEPFIYTGLFLVAFALLVITTALKRPIPNGIVKLITSLDIAWVIASIVLVIADGSYISSIGNVAIIAVAAWVGLMAMLQSRRASVFQSAV